MLDIALGFLRDELNAYLASRSGSDAIKAKLTRIMDETTGKYAFGQELIGVSLLQLEEERVFRAQLPSHTVVNGQQVVQEPELKLNLTVVFAANFKQYDEGLKFLSYVLAFFQSHGAFTPAEYPGLDTRIEKLTVELQSLTYEQLNQVWGFIGGKQLPAAFYKVRMVVVQDAQPVAVQPPVTVISTRLGVR